MSDTQPNRSRVIIDLTHVIAGVHAPFLSGKERGEHARRLFDLDKYDDQQTSILVRIPPEIRSISSSFTLGLFSESVIKRGSLEKFIAAVKFDGERSIVEKIIGALSHGRSGPPVLQ